MDNFPRSAAYLEGHRQILENRRYVTEAGRQWFEIWVPQNPDAWALPKLIFTDISEKPTFWLDLAGSVVNGDCYWLTPTNTGAIDLLWLALAVANSTFIEEFYDHVFHNKLYSGRRRFMTQYVERFPLPNPNTPLSREIIDRVKAVHGQAGREDTKAQEVQLSSLVRRAFGLGEKVI